VGDLVKIPNIGDQLEEKLNKIGIFTYDELKSAGSKEVFLKLHENCGSSCVNTLYALEGAIQHVRWHYLDRETKNHLKKWFADLSIVDPV
jgi:DNA transformation protein